MATFKAIAQQAPIYARYVQTAAANTAPDAFVFVNPTGSGEYFEIVEARAIYEVAGGSGAVADVKVTPSGTALASGTTALAATFDLTATARTPYKATLSATASARQVKPGDSVCVDTGGTLTGLTGLVVEVILRPVRVKRTH